MTTTSDHVFRSAAAPRSRRRGSRTATAAGALTVLALLSACTNAGSSAGAAAEADTLTLGLDLNPPSLDPAQLQSGGSVVPMWQSVFDKPLKIGRAPCWGRVVI